MTDKDVEIMLKNAASSFVPDVLDRVMKAEIKVEMATEEVSNRYNLRRFAIALASVLIIIVGSLSFYSFMNSDAGSIYVDVNPSLEIVYNHFNRVKKINYLSDGTEELFEGANLKGEKIDTAVTMFLNKAEEMGYFSQEDSVFCISASSKDSKKAEKKLLLLEEKAKQYFKEKDIVVGVEKQNASNIDKQEAKNLNISPGKLSVIKKLQQYNPEYSTEQLSDKNMSELVHMLKDFEKENIANNEKEKNNNNGKGNENRKGNR